MAKGLKQHKEHQQAISLLGKDLARRAKRKCELCGSGQVALETYELTPSNEPALSNCLLICHSCKDELVKKIIQQLGLH